jgi:capsular polysaccharide biosynthesis protein
LVGLLGAVAYLNFATPTFVSTARVLVYPTSTDVSSTGARTTGTVNLDTEAQIVKSLPVAAIAAKTLRNTTTTPAMLANHVAVTVPPNTTVLDIAFSSSTAKAAQAGAEAFAKAYVENRNTTGQAAIGAQVDQVQAVIDQLDKQRTRITKKLNDVVAPSSGTARTGLLARRANIDTQLGAATVSLSTYLGTVVKGGVIIFNAQLPGSKTSPNPYLVVPSGLIVGLLLGIALAALREKSDRRVHRSADIERIFQVPVVARPDAGKQSNLEQSPDVEREMQVLYQSLVAPDPDSSLVALIVGPDPRAADELAEVLSSVSARSGSRTTLVRSQSLPDGARNAGSTPGFDLELLDYKSTGIVVDDALRSHAASAVITSLRLQRDLVVLEMPTNHVSVDLLALGHSVDVAVIVVELGRTTRKDVNEIIKDLDRTTVQNIVAISVHSAKR